MSIFSAEPLILQRLRSFAPAGMFETIAAGDRFAGDHEILKLCPAVLVFDETAQTGKQKLAGVDKFKEEQSWSLIVCVETEHDDTGMKTTASTADPMIETVMRALNYHKLSPDHEPMRYTRRDQTFHSPNGWSEYPIIFSQTVTIDLSVAHEIRGTTP